MTTANLENCQELYKLSGWTSPYVAMDGPTPLYDAGFLLRKLPRYQWRRVTGQKSSRVYYLSVVAQNPATTWVAGYHRIDHRRSGSIPYWWGFRAKGDNNHKVIAGVADTPEDALCQLAVALFKANILQKGTEQ